MINNIRIKNQPLFKEFTFPEQEMKPPCVEDLENMDWKTKWKIYRGY